MSVLEEDEDEKEEEIGRAGHFGEAVTFEAVLSVTGI